MASNSATTPMAWSRYQGGPFARPAQPADINFSGKNNKWPAAFYQKPDTFTRFGALHGMNSELETAVELKNFINSPKHSESNARTLFKTVFNPEQRLKEDVQKAQARALLLAARNLNTIEKLRLVQMVSGDDTSPASLLARKALILQQPIGLRDITDAIRNGSRPLAGPGSSVVSALAIALLMLPLVAPTAVLSPLWLHKTLFYIAVAAL